MDSLNKVFIMGHLGSDPQVLTDKQGRAYAKLSVATNRNWQTAEGEKDSRTDWHKIHVWGKRGEMCSKYLKKGAPLFVEGRISVIEVDDAEKGRIRQTFISADTVRFLPFSGRAESNE